MPHICQIARPRKNTEEIRRIPVQERGKRRVEAILDAGAELFASVGFEGTTMEAIAERACTSIGSVYQFFPSKRAVFVAVAERTLERIRTFSVETLTSLPGPSAWRESIAMAIDAVALYQNADPGFRAIMLNQQLLGDLRDADMAVHREMSERVSALIARSRPDMKRGQRLLLATMIVEGISGLLFLAARHPGPMQKQIIEETKKMICAYLAPYVEGFSAPSTASVRERGPSPHNSRS